MSFLSCSHDFDFTEEEKKVTLKISLCLSNQSKKKHRKNDGFVREKTAANAESSPCQCCT